MNRKKKGTKERTQKQPNTSVDIFILLFGGPFEFELI